jgi:polysaccharide export outer membrane protein
MRKGAVDKGAVAYCPTIPRAVAYRPSILRAPWAPAGVPALLLALVAAGGCATIHQPAGGDPSFAAASPPPRPPDTASGVSVALPPPVPVQQDEASVERLIALRDRRLDEGPNLDTPIGVGDVIEVEVPGLKELAQRRVRVAGDGTIALPFVGTLVVKGRTEEQVRRAITEKLEAIMYDPPVAVFVREYRSRQVVVLGSVGQPGSYLPASANDTILDMIAMARGITDEGARQVVFIPREVGATDRIRETMSTLPEGKVSAPDVPRLLRNVDPIVLNLRDLSASRTKLALSLPVRSGDVIIIPEAGKAFLQGWVTKPGPYLISRDLTMLEMIAAAGGPAFQADMSAARLIRAGTNGEKHLFDIDLQAVARGELPDVYVQNGDVVEVGATGPKLAAYALYYFFASVFRIGAAVTVF